MTLNPHPRPDCTPDCFGCKAQTVQLPGFTGPAFKPHFNYSVGKWVNSRREFEAALRQASDENSEKAGCDHKYEPRYPGDIQPIREADQVLDDRAANLTAIANNKPLKVTNV